MNPEMNESSSTAGDRRKFGKFYLRFVSWVLLPICVGGAAVRSLMVYLANGKFSVIDFVSLALVLSLVMAACFGLIFLLLNHFARSNSE
jgi:hypothetical protein